MPKMPAAIDADDDLLAGLKTELSRRFLVAHPSTAGTGWGVAEKTVPRRVGVPDLGVRRKISTTAGAVTRL
ncbi:hypothetical protein [Streptomyces sp. CBG33]|uniref:hypothetical protein n=1 Tax=Streptomyces sp. CBG33 TaxID=2762624 RepID=UPI00164451D4|nr:hypothetical protein [Streptomyces sp. CBG33]